MASPRSMNTFTTAHSHFELEDTSKNDMITTTIEEIALPSENRISIPETLVEEPHIPAMESAQAVPSPTVTTLRKDINWNTTGGRERESPRSYEQVNESKVKAQYYNKAFAVREQPNTIKDRLLRTSVITAELKTNVIIQDEYTFLTTMSAFLAARYNRPESSILITLNHSVCMLFGGSFDPAYMLSITAVADSVKPVLNRRNTALISRFLSEEIQVSSDRGIIKFQGMAEENLATGGVTLATEIEQDTKSTVTQPSSEGFSLSRKLHSGKKRPVRPSPTQNLLTPPESPPRAGLGVDLGQNTHSRTVSDATTSSNPDIDVLKNHLAQLNMDNFEYNRKKPITGKKSGFFRKLVA